MQVGVYTPVKTFFTDDQKDNDEDDCDDAANGNPTQKVRRCHPWFI